MKQIFVYLILSLISIHNSNAQEIKFGFDFGSAIIEKNSYKTNYINKTIFIGSEFKLNNNFYFSNNISYNIISGNNNSMNLSEYEYNHYIIVPIALKLYLPFSNSTKLFTEVGMYPGYHFSNKKETFIGSTKTILTNNNIGYNFGLHTNFGIKSNFNEHWAYEISLLAQKDLLFSYKKSIDKLDANRMALRVCIFRSLQK